MKTEAFSHHCRGRPTIIFSRKESGGGGNQVKLPDVDTGRLVGLKNKLVCHFELTVDVVRDGIS